MVSKLVVPVVNRKPRQFTEGSSLLHGDFLRPTPQQEPPLLQGQFEITQPGMTEQAEFTAAPATTVAVLVDDWIAVVTFGAKQFPRAKDCPPQILTDLGFAWYLSEIVHVHIVLLDIGLVPSGLDYPQLAI